MATDADLFLKGALIAFSIAAPVGPTGVLCIRRTLAFGRFSGLFSGLGSASAGVTYGMILAFGLTFLSEELLSVQFWLRLFGGFFLLYLGIKTFRSQPNTLHPAITHKTYLSDYLSTYILSMTNPITMISYIAIFSSLGLENIESDWEGAISLAFGIFCGSFSWWIILTESIGSFRARITDHIMLWINRVAGCVLFLFALIAWGSLFF